MKYNLIKFLTMDMWHISKKHLSRNKYLTIRHLKIIIVACRGFIDDGCCIKASALTYYTLLAIVPVLALVFAISNGFGLERALEARLYQSFQQNNELLQQVLLFSTNLLARTKGGLIAGIGGIVLLWALIKLLSNIEYSFNSIWKVKAHRSWIRKFTDYLSMALICPFLFILSGSMTVYIATRVKTLIEMPLVFSIAISTLIPYLVIWLLFTSIYLVMPNCKVKVKSALIAGVITGTIVEFIQWLYIHFQIGVTAYNAIYGSFAALPLFLILVQLCWLTVLFGAEIAFAHQNIEDYEYKYSIKHISHNMKNIISLRIVNLIIKNFCADKTPLTAQDISHKLEVPILLTKELLEELIEANVLIKIIDGLPNNGIGYQPAHDVNKISILYVMEALNFHKEKEMPIISSKELETIIKSLNDFTKLIENSPANLLLKNI
jgi:membrane protein